MTKPRLLRNFFIFREAEFIARVDKWQAKNFEVLSFLSLTVCFLNYPCFFNYRTRIKRLWSMGQLLVTTCSWKDSIGKLNKAEHLLLCLVSLVSPCFQACIVFVVNRPDDSCTIASDKRNILGGKIGPAPVIRETLFFKVLPKYPICQHEVMPRVS